MTSQRLENLTRWNPLPAEDVIHVQFRFRDSPTVRTEHFPAVNRFGYVSGGNNPKEHAENVTNARRMADTFRLTVAPFADFGPFGA
jgi:hypothetical protein